jgi:hypothetical protein
VGEIRRSVAFKRARHGRREGSQAEAHRAAETAAGTAQNQNSGEAAGFGHGKEKCPGGGRRKSLKRLDSDKENKVNSFAFLWPGFAGFGQIWLNSA